MHLTTAGGLVVAAAVASVYLAAEASARTLASSFSTAETARHARDVAFTTKITGAQGAYWTQARYRTAANDGKARPGHGSQRRQPEAPEGAAGRGRERGAAGAKPQ